MLLENQEVVQTVAEEALMGHDEFLGLSTNHLVKDSGIGLINYKKILLRTVDSRTQTFRNVSCWQRLVELDFSGCFVWISMDSDSKNNFGSKSCYPADDIKYLEWRYTSCTELCSACLSVIV